MGSVWPRGGPGSWARQCCLQHKHGAASHFHCWLLSALCHPSPVPRNRRARLLHQSTSRASQPLPTPLPDITSVPKLKPSPFSSSVSLQHSSQALRHLQQTWSATSQHAAHGAGARGKEKRSQPQKFLKLQVSQTPSPAYARMCSLQSRSRWLASPLARGPTRMGALWSHGLAAGWLCLFGRLRFLRLLGLDQLRLSDSDKLEGKRWSRSEHRTRVTQSTLLPLGHHRGRICEGKPTSEHPCTQSTTSFMDNLPGEQQKGKQQQRYPLFPEEVSQREKNKQKRTTQGPYSTARSPESRACYHLSPVLPRDPGSPTCCRASSTV